MLLMSIMVIIAMEGGTAQLLKMVAALCTGGGLPGRPLGLHQRRAAGHAPAVLHGGRAAAADLRHARHRRGRLAGQHRVHRRVHGGVGGVSWDSLPRIGGMRHTLFAAILKEKRATGSRVVLGGGGGDGRRAARWVAVLLHRLDAGAGHRIRKPAGAIIAISHSVGFVLKREYRSTSILW